jgi:ABC-2 type transport system permease protein
MIAFLALMRREYLEHRTAFLYAPLVLLALFAIFVGSTLLTHRVTVLIEAVPGTPDRFYGVAYFTIAALWWLYAATLTFFYFADAFHSDTRNNAMLFWKSMPQGDFKILMSKLVAGLTIFPGLIFGVALLSGLLLVVAALALPLAVPAVPVPDIGTLLTSWAALSLVFLCYLVIQLLWYVPFFAWVGALSTVVGRWAIPLALLIPVAVSLFEGVIDFQTAPGGSYVLSFLRERIDMRYDSQPLFAALLTQGPVDAGHTIQRLVAFIDWPQTIGGVVFAVVVVFLASLYRRRVIKG